MRTLPYSAYLLATRYVGVKEVPGSGDNPQIMAWLKLDQDWPEHDEVANCSAFANYVAMLMDLPRSKSLRARSWLEVGQGIHLCQAEQGFDLVIFKRGPEPQPGPEVIDAPGHVAWFDSVTDQGLVRVLGANQGDTVGYATYPFRNVIGVRRLA